ncbi:hypothetical protein ACOMHN_039089 [Nucella lapillus]
MNAIDFYIFWSFFGAVIPPRFQAMWTLFLLHLVSFLWYQPAPCLQQLYPSFFSPALSHPLHYSSPPPPAPVPSVYPLRHYPPPLPSPPSSNLPMRYSRDQLLEIQPSTPNFELVNRLRELRLGVGLPRKRGCRGGRKKLRSIQVVPSRNLHPLMVPPFLQPHPDLQSAVGNAPLSSKHPTHLPTTDCLLSINPLMGGQPSDAPALSPPSPLQQGGQSSNAPALSPPSPLPQGSQPIALALSPSSPLPQDGQPSDAPGLSPSSSTLLLKNKQPVGHSLLNNKMMLNLKKKQKKTSTDENHIIVVTPGPEPEPSPEKEKPGRKPKGFDWQTYLDDVKAIGAPARFFKDPFPSQKNGFKAGMRLEGVDPKHQNLFCVLSVAEIQGYRLRLHFDGYSECYDFWCNADSPFIFPVGWCEKNGKPLQPPKHVPKQNFNWATYLRTTKSVAAPKSLFANQPATTVTPSAFRVGMKLEAVDRKNTALVCVATVADILGDKVLVHFDGWEDIYDYWCDITSPYIHPMGWCQDNARLLSPPCDWHDVDSFTWEDYLTQTKSQAVPARAFKPRPPVGFEVGMRVEVVDRRNPILVRAATVREVREQQVCVHFDGWPDMYDYFLDDDCPDIKPPGWCSRTGSPLEPPYMEETFQQSSCPTPGCNGVGHIKGAKYVGHHSAFGCPYSSVNMNKESTLQDRLGSTRSEEGSAAPLAVRVKLESGEVRKCPTPGCDSSGHITGKFTSHHRLSGCPLYEKNVMRMNAELAARPAIRPRRGRKRKYPLLGEPGAKDENAVSVKKERLDRPPSMFMSNIHQSVFLSSVPAVPSPEGPAFWDYHARLLPGVSEFKGDEVKEWTVDQVATFIGSLPGCQDVETNFREQEIDGDSLLLMSQADIVKILNVKLGPALKIFTSVVFFQQTVDS